MRILKHLEFLTSPLPCSHPGQIRSRPAIKLLGIVVTSRPIVLVTLAVTLCVSCSNREVEKSLVPVSRNLTLQTVGPSRGTVLFLVAFGPERERDPVCCGALIGVGIVRS